jgi:hypothetical protein
MNSLHAEQRDARARYQRWIDALLKSASAQSTQSASELLSQWRASRSLAPMTLSAIASPQRWVVNSALTAESAEILTP